MHHRNVRDDRGVSLVVIAATIFIVMLVIIVGFYGVLAKVIIMGNYWVTEDGALQCVQGVEPKAKRVVRLQRNAWSPSVVTVEDAEGKRSTFALDADVFWNADCERADGSRP